MIVSLLVEGNSIRSIERVTKVHRDTIMRLGVRVGKYCKQLHDKHLHGFHSRYLQADEIWTFCGKKENRLSLEEWGDTRLGDQYIFVALDAESKLIPSFLVGKRDGFTARMFVKDLKERLNGNGRVQLSTDGFRAYLAAVKQSFGDEIDFAQQVKSFDGVNPGDGRYSPPRVSGVVSTVISGSPDENHISTSFVESNNLVMRMRCRRLTRLVNAYSKKLENLTAAIALHFAHYNFVSFTARSRPLPPLRQDWPINRGASEICCLIQIRTAPNRRLTSPPGLHTVKNCRFAARIAPNCDNCHDFS